jgi:hypothetical protein
MLIPLMNSLKQMIFREKYSIRVQLPVTFQPGDLYALTSSGEWIKQSASSGGQGTDNYNDLSNKPSINNVTLQGNKSLSDIGTYSKAEIDGMTEIETIELIHDETEDTDYFPADKMYILEQRKPFIIRTNHSKVYTIRMYTFSVHQGLIEQDDSKDGYLYINIEMGYDSEAEQVLIHFNGCIITKSTREVRLLEH